MSSDEPFTPGEDDGLLSSAILADSLDALGLRDQVLRRRLAPVAPGSRAYGRASTARFETSTVDAPGDPYGAAIAFVDGLAAGWVAVVSTGADPPSACWGELFSAAAMGRGAVGVVTDGDLRDSARIAAMGFPAFGGSRRPVDYRMRMALVETGGTVKLEGVPVSHGDLILADDDGVVVVPREHEAAVLARARTRASAETVVLEALRRGAGLREVWDRYRVL